MENIESQEEAGRTPSGNGRRVVRCIKEVLPIATRTALWIIKITVGVSLAILFLKYFNILPLFSDFISPVFNYLGLPGEAALAYVTGYFVNVYAAISVAASLELDVRAMTILSVMVLCSHNMITETAVQKKSGSSAVRIVLVRTISAFFLAFVLNRFLPGEVVSASGSESGEELLLGAMLREWAVSTLWLILKMGVLIYSLSIMQKLLAEFGVIKLISKFLKPLLAVFGLPARTSLLWIVANILGLAYGAAIMIQESRSGKISREDIDLLNTHISIAHSNFEDLFLLSSVGGIWYVLLLSRWLMAMVLVWLQRLEIFVADKIRSRI